MGRDPRPYLTPYNANPYSSLTKRLMRLAARQGIKYASGYASNKVKEAFKKKKTKWSGNSTGVYVGKFNKPNKKVNTPSMKNMTQSKGYHITTEIYGKIEDPHCVYIGHSTCDIVQKTKVITGALLRLLFAKAGLCIKSNEEVLPLFNNIGANTDAGGFKIVYTVVNPVTLAQFSQSFTTSNTDTLKSIIDSFSNWRLYLEQYLYNKETSEVKQMSLFATDAGSDGYRQVATLNLKSLILHYYSSSILTVQNRTAGDTSTEGDKSLDRVDNQPLAGYMYQFHNADPQLNTTISNLKQVNFTPENGLHLIRAEEMSGDMSEPPRGAIWQNCTKTSSISLEAGNMKKTYINYRKSGLFGKVLKKMRVEYEDGFNVVGVPGKCQLIALEERLRTPGTNLVTVQYEKQGEFGCYFQTTKSQNSTLTTLETANINNP